MKDNKFNSNLDGFLSIFFALLRIATQIIGMTLFVLGLFMVVVGILFLIISCIFIFIPLLIQFIQFIGGISNMFFDYIKNSPDPKITWIIFIVVFTLVGVIFYHIGDALTGGS